MEERGKAGGKKGGLLRDPIATAVVAGRFTEEGNVHVTEEAMGRLYRSFKSNPQPWRGYCSHCRKRIKQEGIVPIVERVVGRGRHQSKL